MKRWILILCAALLLCASCSKKETQPTVSAQFAEQIELGQKYLKEGKYEEAIAAFRQVADFGDSTAEVYLGLYEAYMALEQLEDAVNALEEGYTATGDEDIKELYQARLEELAQAYWEDDNFDGAAEAFQRLIKLDKTNVDTYMSLYDVYMIIEDYEQAVNALAVGYKNTGDEDLKETWLNELLNLGQMCLDEENYEQAITYLEKLLENGGSDVDVYIALADAWSGMEEYEKALEILAQAPDQENNGIKNAIGRQKARMGEQNYDEGNNDVAISYLKEAIAIAPDEAEAYTTLITLYMELARMSEAKSIVESGVARFVKTDSPITGERFDNFLYAAVDYYTTQDDLEACARFLEQVAALRPDDVDFADTLEGTRSMMADEAYAKAEELLEKGDANGASGYFKRAFSLAPDNFEAGMYATDVGTYYLKADGSYLIGWYEAEGGEKYYFSGTAGATYGQALLGWQQLDGSYYYFDEGGCMLVDDTTPDGKYVGLDGKLTEGGAPEETEEAEEELEEETDEAETEEETETESVKVPQTSAATETTAASKPGNQGSSQTQNGSQTQSAGAGKDIVTLNADTLRRMKEGESGETVACSELFGVSGRTISLNDIYTSLQKYGVTVRWESEEAPYCLAMGDLKLWLMPGESWSNGAVIVRGDGTTDRKKSLFEKALPEEFYVVVEFLDEPVAGNSRVDIDKIEEINQK